MFLLFPMNFSVVKSKEKPLDLLHILDFSLKANSQYSYDISYKNNSVKYQNNKVKTKIKIIEKKGKSLIFAINYGNNIVWGSLFVLVIPFIIFLTFFVSKSKILLLSIYPFILYLLYINTSDLKNAKKELLFMIKNS